MNILVTREQYERLAEPQKKTIIVNESQLGIIKEAEKEKVLRYEFESKVRNYMRELKDNPCHPNYDEFFKNHDIPEELLQNKMINLGLIKRSDTIKEPVGADGKKHSMHGRKFIFSSNKFDDKIGKLYNEFFNNGNRVLKECDGGCDAPSDGGATNAEGVGGQYTVPFGGIMRRNIGVSGKTYDENETNIDAKPALDRKKGKIAVNTKK